MSPKPGNELSSTQCHIKYSAGEFQMSRLYHLYIHVYLITKRAKERFAMLVFTLVDFKSPYETIYKIVAFPCCSHRILLSFFYPYQHSLGEAYVYGELQFRRIHKLTKLLFKSRTAYSFSPHMSIQC